MTPEKFQLIHADCLDAMNDMPANSIDAIITDPPYGLSFMGKNWDHGIPGPEFWKAALRIAKPGAHLLAFGGTRTFHRLTSAVEDAGWEIRDCLVWCYGQGFPKSHNIGIALEKLESTDAAKQWHGWGTNLKPAWEPIILARKPLEGTVAENVLKHGCGGLNVDGCRIKTGKQPGKRSYGGFNSGGNSNCYGDSDGVKDSDYSAGRWPANFIHDGSAEVLECFPVTTQIDSRPHKKQHQPPGQNGIYGTFDGADNTPAYGDTGTAARFFQTCPPDAKRLFYCGKASKRDRDRGCEGLEAKQHQSGMGGAMPVDDDGKERDRFKTVSRNHHPTVKPTTLMQYLCRLITPPDGVILDPFAGSGSTGKGALAEGFRFIGIEKDLEYIEIARARLSHSAETPRQLTLF